MHQAQRGTRTPSRGSASLSSPPAAVATGSAALPIEGGSSPASTGLGSLNRQPSVRMASPPMKAGTRGGREATPTPTRITPSSSTGVKSPFHSDSPPNYAGMRSYKKTPTSTSHPIHSITHSPETRSVINRWTPNLRLREPGQEAEVFYTQPAALKVNFTKETIASIKKYFALLALTLEFSEGAMQPLNEVNIFDTSISASMRCADLNTPAGKSQLLNIEYLICLAMSLIQDARLHQARGVTDISSILTIIKNIHQLVVSNAQLQKLLSDDKATLIEHARDAEMKQVLSFLAVDMEVMKGFLEHCDTGAKAQNYYRPEVKAGYTYPPKPLHYYNKDYVAKRAARIRPGMINWLAKYYDLQAEKKHAPAPFKVISKEMSRQKDMVIDPVIPAIKEKDPTKLAAHLTEQVKQGGATLIKIKALIVQMTHLRVDEADKRRELNDELLLSLAIAKLSIDQTLQTLKLIESMTSRVPVEHKSSIEDQVRLLSGIEGADAPQGLILQFREMLLKHHDELIKDPHISDFAGRLALAIEISSLVIDVFPDMSVIATSVAAATAALPKRVSVVPAHSRGSVSQLASATIANPMLAAVTSRGSLPTISAQPTVRKSVVLEPGAEAGLEMTAIPGEVPVEAATTASGSVNAGAVRVTKRDSTVTPHTGAVPRASTLVPSYAARATTTEIINPLARSSLVAPPTNARSSLPVTAVIGVVDASSEESATPTKRSQVTAQYAVRRSKVAVDMNASLLAPEVLAGMVNDYIFAQNTMAVQDLLSLAQVTKLNIQAQGSDVLATSGRASIAVEPYKLAPKDRTAKIIENALQKKLQGRKRTITGISCIAILLGAGAIVGGAIAAVENKKTTGAASPVPADGNTTSTQTATPYPSGLSPSTGVSILSSISYSPTAEAYSATSSATYGASASVTSNVNPSASVTATALNSATGTSSITAQASQSSSENPLASMSSTPVNSATSTPVTPISASASNSESASLSLTPASSVSSSVSGTHTASTTAIVTPSATSSETASLGASLSQTATFSPTPSPSTTLSRTASATPSSTATNSDTTSQTASASRSATQSETLTPTSTAAVTPSITPSNTHTGTQSGSLTASLSNTPSGTQTATMSFTPTGTLTQTGTGSACAFLAFINRGCLYFFA